MRKLNNKRIFLNIAIINIRLFDSLVSNIYNGKRRLHNKKAI